MLFTHYHNQYLVHCVKYDGDFAGRTLERIAQMRPFQHERDE
jgi:hypothetical protein